MANKKTRNRGARAGGKKARATKNKLEFAQTGTSLVCVEDHARVETEAARIVRAVNGKSQAKRPIWWNKSYTAEKSSPAGGSVTSHTHVVTEPAYCASHKPTKVFLINDGKNHLYAGAGTQIGRAVEEGKLEPALVIDLADMHSDFSPEWPVKTNAEAKIALPDALWAKPAFKNPPVLWVDWSDGDVPDGITADWWRLMADTILRLPGDVTVNCMGGHGRTGTFLAIVGHLMGAIPAKECPVEWVRSNYCFDAVETEPQIDYIEGILNITVKATATGWYSSTSHSTANKWPAHLSTAEEMEEWKELEKENGAGPLTSADAYTAGVMRAVKAAQSDHRKNTVAHAAGVGPYEDDDKADLFVHPDEVAQRTAALTTEEALADDFDEDGRLLRGM